MNYILYIILFLFMNLILSCKRNNVKDNSGQGFTVVTINNYHDKTIPFSEFSTRIDTIELQTNPYFMGEILDFCMSNSLLYVIDMNGAAWIFKTSSGNLVKRIHRIGHGRGEYTSIQAVTSKDSLVYLMKNEDKKMKILHTLDEFMKTRITDSENGREPQRKKRLPDRTEEYRRKWNENMFLNDFDEDDENAGVNIPLYKLYQLPFYRLKNQKTDLSNLGERLDKCVQGQNIKNRMLLILGQPGMGKSTMITWFVHRYQEKQDVDKKEVLVYRFTDLDVEWSIQINGERKRGST